MSQGGKHPRIKLKLYNEEVSSIEGTLYQMAISIGPNQPSYMVSEWLIFGIGTPLYNMCIMCKINVCIYMCVLL